MLELVTPTLAYGPSYLEALREGFSRGDGQSMTAAEIGEIASGLAGHLAGKLRQDGSIRCPDGLTRPRVPSTVLWLVDGEKFLGEISFRHALNDFLAAYGGHIGYGVRPAYRRRGLATVMLRMMLDEIRRRGELDRVFVTCDPSNVGSRKVIEANGGQLEKVVRLPWAEHETCYYWISLH